MIAHSMRHITQFFFFVLVPSLSSVIFIYSTVLGFQYLLNWEWLDRKIARFNERIHFQNRLDEARRAARKSSSSRSSLRRSRGKRRHRGRYVRVPTTFIDGDGNVTQYW